MKTYPQIDLSAWKQVGEGGNGAAYVNDAEPGVLLKVNTNTTSGKQMWAAISHPMSFFDSSNFLQ